MSTFIENQNWRYATKKFDANKKISATDLETLKEAMRLSASSYGLQPYNILVIENPEIRKQLQPVSWGQTQIVDASHLFVIANFTQINENDIDNLIANTAKTRGINPRDLTPYATLMRSKITPLSPEEKANWTAKQTYIALGNLLAAAAELKIDATPMEGFEAQKYNEILGLDKQNLNASLVIPLGYRHPDDTYQHLKKVRKSNQELFVTI